MRPAVNKDDAAEEGTDADATDEGAVTTVAGGSRVFGTLEGSVPIPKPPTPAASATSIGVGGGSLCKLLATRMPPIFVVVVLLLLLLPPVVLPLLVCDVVSREPDSNAALADEASSAAAALDTVAIVKSLGPLLPATPLLAMLLLLIVIAAVVAAAEAAVVPPPIVAAPPMTFKAVPIPLPTELGINDILLLLLLLSRATADMVGSVAAPASVVAAVEGVTLTVSWTIEQIIRYERLAGTMIKKM